MELVWSQLRENHWADIFSDNFSICSGIRQGEGILSPFLFGVYIDELSLCLQVTTFFDIEYLRNDRR